MAATATTTNNTATGATNGAAGSSGEPQLFEDNFTITLINSAKYDRVSRISGHNLDQDIEFTLDVNTELYPCAVNDTINLVLASTLNLDGSKDDGKGWRETQRGEATLADLFDYVCHGKVYRFEEGDGESMYV